MKKIDNIKVFYYFNFFLYFRPHWPIAIIYYAAITGSYALATAIFSVVFMSQAILELPTGYISDSMGRKKVLIISSIFSLLSLILYAIGMNFWILFFGAFAEGLSRALYSGTQKSLLYETLAERLEEDKFDEKYGKTNSILQIALAISAAIGGLFALYSLKLVLIMSIIPQIFAVISCFFFREPKHIERKKEKISTHFIKSLKLIWSNRKLKLISFSEVIDFGFGEAMFYFQAAFFKMLIPEWLIGFVRCINHTFSAIGFWYSDKVAKLFGYKKLLIGGNIITSIIQYFAVLIPTVASPFLLTLVAIFFGPSDTARNSLMQKEFSDHQRATMDSMVSLTSSIFFSIFSLILGFIADIYSPSTAMLFGISSNLIVIYIYTKVFK